MIEHLTWQALKAAQADIPVPVLVLAPDQTSP